MSTAIEFNTTMNKKTFNPNEWLDEEPSISAEPKVDDLKPIPVEQEIDELVSRVESAAIDIAPTYSDWRDLGFALADALGENGRGYYQRLSRFYSGYNEQETDRQYDKCVLGQTALISANQIARLGAIVSMNPIANKG